MHNTIWDQILALKEKLKGTSTWDDLVFVPELGFLFASNCTKDQKGIFRVHKDGADLDFEHTVSISREDIYLSYGDNVRKDYIEIVKLYLPLLLQNLCNDKVTVICHVAQSLDGMMSTVEGNSKWIGNNENLIHAHRIRALVDGVLVGGNTAALDMPRLDVRHVKGKNPKRIILSNSFAEFGSLPKTEAETILLRSKGNKNTISPNKTCCVIEYNEARDGEVITDVLAHLSDHGVKSIMVEGGPQTISSFFKAGVVDFLQVHVAPIVFGSGRKTFCLPEISNVDDGWKMDSIVYTQMGDAMMMTGQPISDKKSSNT